MYSTIYDLNGNIITDGVQSQTICDATINTAKQIARDKKHSVVVEDRGTQECYRVTPTGRKLCAPRDWTPTWKQEQE